MPGKFANKTCVFCQTRPSSPTGEHVPPLWFLELFGLAEGPYSIRDDGVPRPRRDASDWQQESIPKLTLPACEQCNGELNRRFEQPVKELVRGMTLGRVQLAAPDAHTVGIWLLKTWLEQTHPAGCHSAPGGFGEPWELNTIAADLYGWMTNGDAPPNGLHVWVGRLDPREVRAEPERAMPLSEGSHVHQFAWSFAAAGLLDVTLIYSASAPIAHPLEEGGRVVKAWPITTSDELDIGGLPYISRNELAWTVWAPESLK